MLQVGCFFYIYNMIRDKKLIVVTPAGRKRYMELLQHFIINNPLVDEWHIWQHTNDTSDIAYFNTLKSQFKKVKIVAIKETFERNKIYKFAKFCMDKNTVYIRLDDDIVWMSDNSLEKLALYRLDHEFPFIIYGNIINNSICDFIHQKTGAFTCDQSVGYLCMDDVGWKDPHVAEKKHLNFFKKYYGNTIHDYMFQKWSLTGFERCSVNVICWTGELFQTFNGQVGQDEEHWLAVEAPMKYGRYNEICGQTLFCHFSFYTQRGYLDSTNILSKYRKIIDPRGLMFTKKCKIFF